MYPVCVVLDLGRPGKSQPLNLDDEALLEFGKRVLGDLRQGKHSHANIQTPWGDTYSSIPSEVSIKRLQVATKTFLTSWEFWSQSRHQVEQWSQRLDDETCNYLRAFLSATARFRPSKLQLYAEFLLRLFTSSQASPVALYDQCDTDTEHPPP